MKFSTFFGVCVVLVVALLAVVTVDPALGKIAGFSALVVVGAVCALDSTLSSGRKAKSAGSGRRARAGVGGGRR